MWPGDSTAGDERFFHDWGMVVEQERRFTVRNHPCAVRLLAYVNQGNMGSYKSALSAPALDIDLTHATRHTAGVGLNIEQEITKNIGVFSRLGWNDGHNEAWMFTDTSHTGSLGVSIKGAPWHRNDDTIGVGFVVSGLSQDAQNYFAAGGKGILSGDGGLQYAKEKLLETYYDCKLTNHLRGALDYQFLAAPAFNSSRGPVSVFATRLYFEY
ncbi:MAG: hypothetical protein CXZ00_11080 [Acidobacteria bacterium]|nr:MAG: hypothetical protein CXZ00_11080 [Acidobacteriota bacterium]